MVLRVVRLDLVDLAGDHAARQPLPGRRPRLPDPRARPDVPRRARRDGGERRHAQGAGVRLRQLRPAHPVRRASRYARSARARNEKAKFARDRALEYVLAAAIFVGAGFLPEIPARRRVAHRARGHDRAGDRPREDGAAALRAEPDRATRRADHHHVRRGVREGRARGRRQLPRQHRRGHGRARVHPRVRGLGDVLRRRPEGRRLRVAGRAIGLARARTSCSTSASSASRSASRASSRSIPARTSRPTTSRPSRSRWRSSTWG